MGKILKISDYKENEAVINRGHRRAVARQNLAALCSVLPPLEPKKMGELEAGLARLVESMDKTEWNKRKNS